MAILDPKGGNEQVSNSYINKKVGVAPVPITDKSLGINSVDEALKRAQESGFTDSNAFKYLQTYSPSSITDEIREGYSKANEYLKMIRGGILSSGKQSAAPSEYARILSQQGNKSGGKGLAESVSGTILSQGRNVGILG